MKRVLIPTDFSIRSLNMVQFAVNHFAGQKIEIILFHIVTMPTSIADLMLLPRRKNEYYNVISNEFYEATQVLKNRYASSIHSFNISILHGSTSMWFRNYIDGYRIDAIVDPGELVIKAVFDNSVNMLKLIRKAKCTLINTQVVSKENVIQVPSMAELVTLETAV